MGSEMCIRDSFIALSIILQSLSLCIFTKISWLTINFKTENGSRLITEYYAFTICVDQFNFLLEKFGVSAYSQDRLGAEYKHQKFQFPLLDAVTVTQ